MAREVKRDRIGIVAAGLAFYAMLAVFPALIAFVSIYGLVADPSQVTEQMSRLAGLIPGEAASLLEDQLTGITETSPNVLGWTALIAVLGALWTASGGTQQLIDAVNLAHDEDEGRGFLRRRGVALLLTLVFIVVGLIALTLIMAIPPFLAEVGLPPAAELAVDIGRFVLLALVLVVVLAVIYRYGPDRDEPRWRWVSWGAVAATVVWLAASILFSVYVSNFGRFGETYGSLAGVIVLLLWFFITGLAILLGAEINSEIEHQTARDSTVGEPRPMGRREAQKADTLPEPTD